MNRRDFFAFSSAAALAVTPATGAGARDRGGVPRHGPSSADFGAVGDGEADDTEALQSALDALAGFPTATLLTLLPGEYRVSRPLRLDLERKRTDGIWGISAYGARIRSDIGNRRDVLAVNSATVARYFLIEGLAIRGRGKERHGLSLHSDGQGNYLYNAALRDVVVEGCGGDGCRMIGNIFESQIINSYFRDNRRNGMTCGHGTDGGVLSALHVFGCVFGGNRKHGAALVRKTNDVSFNGCYFLLNGEYGLVASNGCVLLAHSGFENNHDRAKSFADGSAGARINNFGTMIGCTAYSIRNQTDLVDGYLVNKLVLIGCTGSGGARAADARLARLDGNGTSEVTVIGSEGGIEATEGVALTEFGKRAAGARFGDSWDSDNLVQIGEHRLWVDAKGALRMKKGSPRSDEDGHPVGGQARR